MSAIFSLAETIPHPNERFEEMERLRKPPARKIEVRPPGSISRTLYGIVLSPERRGESKNRED